MKCVTQADFSKPLLCCSKIPLVTEEICLLASSVFLQIQRSLTKHRGKEIHERILEKTTGKVCDLSSKDMHHLVHVFLVYII